ncbi:hypothetical protein, partial [Granulicoccus phenolivorans]|uniref:hypothetical protein n=1 Tax=Granulicoccus phenolivorans TaxID=266854 RepID=UPI001B7F922D
RRVVGFPDASSFGITPSSFPRSGASNNLRALHNDKARRDILLSQLASLRVRRGLVGRRFDKDRVLLDWNHPASVLICPNSTEPSGE